VTSVSVFRVFRIQNARFFKGGNREEGARVETDLPCKGKSQRMITTAVHFPLQGRSVSTARMVVI